MEENKKIMPRNVLEEMVDLRVDELMAKSGICCCMHCRADVVTYALNHLPPKYTISRGGEIFTRFHINQVQFQADVTAAILTAIERVGTRAHHDRIEKKD